MVAGGSNNPATSDPEWLDGFSGNFNDFPIDTEFLGMNSERSSSGFMSPNELINAHIAYGYGLFGKDTTIAIMDVGTILPTLPTPMRHQEFGTEEEKTITPDPNLDQPALTPIIADGQNHATHVAGLAAGLQNDQGMMGIAPEADLLITNMFGPTTIDWITEEGADVWNNSWGWSGDSISDVGAEFQSYSSPSEGLASKYSSLGLGTSDWNNIVAAIDRYQARDGVVVWSVSNDSEFFDAFFSETPVPIPPPATDADVSAALPELFPELKEAWITVVNVVRGTTEDPSNLLTKEGGHILLSAPCGSTAEYCLSMDGFNITSSVYHELLRDAQGTPTAITGSANDKYDSLTGTSMAAPMVSGAIALLRDAFPNHTGEQLVIRLLASADNSWFTEDGIVDYGNGITHAYSEIWGHGIPDLAEALKPIGTIITTSAANQAHVLSDGSSEIQMSRAFGSSFETALSQRSFIMQDGLDGRFMTSLGNFVRTVEHDDLQELANDWHRQARQDLVELSLPIFSGFTLEFDRRHDVTTLVQQQNGASVALRSTFSNGNTLRASYGRTINDALGFQAQHPTTTTLRTQSEPFAIPFTGFASASLWGTWQSSDAADRWTIGWFGNQDEVGANEYVGTNDSFGNATNDERPDAKDAYASTGVITEKTWTLGNLAAVQLTGGTLTEQGGLLGTRTSGAFANDVSTTAFARSAVHVDVMPDWSVMAHYLIGHSWAEADEKTLFTDFSNIATDSFAVSVTGQDVFRNRDQVQVTFYQPLRALSGTTTVTLPTGQDAANNYALRYTSETIDLTPKGRELRLIGSYSQEPWEGAQFDFTATLTHQRLHDPTAGFSADIFSGVKFVF